MAANLQPLDSDDDDLITEINVVPLVDIILVVLIVFMITASLIAKQAIEVELPQASTGEAPESTTLALTLTAAGDLYLNGTPTNEEILHAYLPEAIQKNEKIQAIIAADQDVRHGDVVHLIDFVRQHGIYKFALNIDPVPTETTP